MGYLIDLGKEFPDHKLPYTQFPKMHLPENLYFGQLFPNSFIVILLSLSKRKVWLSPIPNVIMVHCHRIKKSLTI